MPDPNIPDTSVASAANAAQPSAGEAEASVVSKIEKAVEAEALSFGAWLRDKLRATPLLIFFLVAFPIVVATNPAKAGLVLWGVSRVGLFAWLGYVIDRAIFGRLKGLSGIELGTAWKRRAIIVAATLIAGAMLP